MIPQPGTARTSGREPQGTLEVALGQAAEPVTRALAGLARERGCYGMWVLTDHDNAAALATYRRAIGVTEGGQVMLQWTFDQA